VLSRDGHFEIACRNHFGNRYCPGLTGHHACSCQEKVVDGRADPADKSFSILPNQLAATRLWSAPPRHAFFAYCGFEPAPGRRPHTSVFFRYRARRLGADRLAMAFRLLVARIFSQRARLKTTVLPAIAELLFGFQLEMVTYFWSALDDCTRYGLSPK